MVSVLVLAAAARFTSSPSKSKWPFAEKLSNLRRTLQLEVSSVQLNRMFVLSCSRPLRLSSNNSIQSTTSCVSLLFWFTFYLCVWNGSCKLILDKYYLVIALGFRFIGWFLCNTIRVDLVRRLRNILSHLIYLWWVSPSPTFSFGNLKKILNRKCLFWYLRVFVHHLYGRILVWSSN